MKQPKVMKDLHKIREEMAKLSEEEREELFKKASEDYKRLVAS